MTTPRTTNSATYSERRDTIRTYFDRTALNSWKRFASDAPLGRVREAVRAGRLAMRAELISRLPDDLNGWRVLDAGCGAGHLAVELAKRGADVVGIDLSPDMIGFARDGLPEIEGNGSVTLYAGDMLTHQYGRFDAVVAMDSVIHYSKQDCVAAIETLAANTNHIITFSVAPKTPLLAAMRAASGLFPRADRAPLIEPISTKWLSQEITLKLGDSGWNVAQSARISKPFYVSEAMEITQS